MGLLVGWLAFWAGVGWTPHLRLFVATGVLGGYTTFSTFSLETVLLIERNQIGLAALYVGGSVALGVLGLWAGLALIRSLS
jgi:fluoride exporter